MPEGRRNEHRPARTGRKPTCMTPWHRANFACHQRRAGAGNSGFSTTYLNERTHITLPVLRVSFARLLRVDAEATLSARTGTASAAV